MERQHAAIMMKSDDHVAVALAFLPAGTPAQVACGQRRMTVRLLEAVEFGHKFAVAPIRAGEDIRKYGEVIGAAVCDIAPGMHVHVHNLEGKRGRGDQRGHGG